MLCFGSEARASRWCGTKADANAAHAALGGRWRREEEELTHLRTDAKKNDAENDAIAARNGFDDGTARVRRDSDHSRCTSTSRCVLREKETTSASEADGAGPTVPYGRDGNALATRAPRWTTRLTSTLARAASIRTTIGTGEMRGAASDGTMVRLGTETPAQGREIQRD